MESHYERYIEALQHRHARDLELIRVALNGRRPRALRAIERQQGEIERETRAILETVGGERA